jgi:hypothetical protein
MAIAEPAVVPIAPVRPVEELSLRTRRGRVLLGTITAAHFAHHVSNSLLNPLLPLIRDTFALSYAQSGFAVSAYALSLGFSNGPIGLLADRVGPRKVIVVGLVLTGLVSVALAQAGDYGQLLVLLLALGIISGTYHAPAAALIARSFSPRVRGAAMGFHITGGHLSFFAAPLLAAYLATTTRTWRTAYLWFAIVPVVLGALLWVTTSPDRRARAAGDLWAPFREIRTVFRTIGPLVSLSVAFQVGISAMFAFLALYLVDARRRPRSGSRSSSASSARRPEAGCRIASGAARRSSSRSASSARRSTCSRSCRTSCSWFRSPSSASRSRCAARPPRSWSWTPRLRTGAVPSSAPTTSLRSRSAVSPPRSSARSRASSASRPRSAA